MRIGLFYIWRVKQAPGHEHGHLAIVEYLNEQLGASLNVKNREKQTPLHLTAQCGHFNVVRYLVR
jgi:ankyrin repeat protein